MILQKQSNTLIARKQKLKREFIARWRHMIYRILVDSDQPNFGFGPAKCKFGSVSVQQSRPKPNFLVGILALDTNYF
jgi:hypothetical protein